MDKAAKPVQLQDKMYSSYAQNHYGEIFEDIVRTHDVHKIIELGVLYGYSTTHLAKGLSDNKIRLGKQGHLDAYDLWDDYPYRHTTLAGTQRIIDENGLTDFITLNKGDAFEAYKNHPDGSVCMMHVDISNTGETIRKIMAVWDAKVRPGGIILFEGGSVERDNIEWMVKYGKPPIRAELKNNPIIQKSYAVKTYDMFPSVTMLCKNKK